MLAINQHPAGATIKLTLDRHGEVLTRTVDLAKFPATGPVIATNRPTLWRGARVDYTSRMPNAPFGELLLEQMARGGVAVVEVVPDSPADQAGLRPGQIITQVGDDKVKNPAEFARAVAKSKGPVALANQPRDRHRQVNESMCDSNPRDFRWYPGMSKTKNTRSHAPRGNAVFDAPRRLPEPSRARFGRLGRPVRGCAGALGTTPQATAEGNPQTTRSVADGIPTRSVGTSITSCVFMDGI